LINGCGPETTQEPAPLQARGLWFVTELQTRPAIIAEAEAPAADAVVVLDFGSQYSQLITRRVRDAGVYCELKHHDTPWDEIAPLRPKGVILSGGPASVYEPDAPQIPDWVWEQRLPVLGICYGMQLMAYQLGGKVVPASRREYGPATIEVVEGADCPLFVGLPPELNVWMSHGDHVEAAPPGFVPIARTENALAARSSGSSASARTTV